MALAAGQYIICWWLVFSVLALNIYTGIRHQAERGNFLDYRDQMIDAQFYRAYLAGEKPKQKNAKERMVQETACEVEKNPDVLPIIEAQNPSLARAIEKISRSWELLPTARGATPTYRILLLSKSESFALTVPYHTLSATLV